MFYSICEEFVKTVTTERFLENAGKSGDAAFNAEFRRVGARFRIIQKPATKKFLELLSDSKAAPSIAVDVVDALDEIFLLRNCLVHNGARVSAGLARQISGKYSEHSVVVLSSNDLATAIRAVNMFSTTIFEFNWGSQL